jgi:hypothetical protein
MMQMKKYIFPLIFLLFGSMVGFAQNTPENSLQRASFRNTILEIRTLYGTNPSKYADSIRTKYFDAVQGLTLKEEKEELDERSKWYKKTDSIISLNKIDVTGQMSINFGLSANQGYVGAQYAFLLYKFMKFDVGIGSGVEYVNRSMGLVQVLQAPVFITNKYFIARHDFLNFDYGFTFPLSANYSDRYDKIISFNESELKSNYFINIGFGRAYSEKSSMQFNIRNQSLGVPEPLNQRVWMFGLKFNF